MTSLVFFKNKKTIYDTISNTAIVAFSIILLIFQNDTIMLPLSYLSFGLMWIISCVTKIPLTAYYSINNYNGDSALKNPLFMQTNKILTFLWGFLYLLTSIWTFYLMRSEISIYTAVINNLLPVIMCIFTKWFQNWYPAWYAKGK